MDLKIGLKLDLHLLDDVMHKEMRQQRWNSCISDTYLVIYAHQNTVL